MKMKELQHNALSISEVIAKSGVSSKSSKSGF